MDLKHLPITKRLDGTYTRLLRSAFDISLRNHPTIAEIYGKLPRISNVVRRRRLALAGHVSRHDEPAGELLIWIPEEDIQCHPLTFYFDLIFYL